MTHNLISCNSCRAIIALHFFLSTLLYILRPCKPPTVLQGDTCFEHFLREWHSHVEHSGTQGNEDKSTCTPGLMHTWPHAHLASRTPGLTHAWPHARLALRTPHARLASRTMGLMHNGPHTCHTYAWPHARLASRTTGLMHA